MPDKINISSPIIIARKHGDGVKIYIKEDEFHMSEKVYNESGNKIWSNDNVDIRYIGNYGNVDSFFAYMIQNHNFEKVI